MELVHVLAAVVGILVGVIATLATLSRLYVSKNDCSKSTMYCDRLREEQRFHEAQWKAALNSRLDKMDMSSNIQYHMLRAIVSHMDNLPAEAKTKILNINGAGKSTV